MMDSSLMNFELNALHFRIIHVEALAMPGNVMWRNSKGPLLGLVAPKPPSKVDQTKGCQHILVHLFQERQIFPTRHSPPLT